MIRAIIVDDESYIKRSLRKLIETANCGYEVAGEASHGEEALALIDRCAPQLVITDMRMPVMNGMRLIEEIRRRRLPAEIVIISAYEEFEYAQSGLRFGAFDYLLKPVVPEALYAVLHKLREKLLPGTDAAALPAPAASAPAAEDRADGDGKRNWSTYQFVRKAKQAVEQRYADPSLDLQTVADGIGISISHLSRCFKEETGVSFLRYLTELRIERAKLALVDPATKIYEVAAIVGFGEYPHFCRMFKKYTGLSPSEYRSKRL
ncbi:MAG: response regulator [Paenibacillaceae bacterium]|nr:response regulator [Paenibacillaceae bacterium]